jgi:hypothetical protein
LRLNFRNEGAERPQSGPNGVSKLFEVKGLRDESRVSDDSRPVAHQTLEKPSPLRVDEGQAVEVEANAVW